LSPEFGPSPLLPGQIQLWSMQFDQWDKHIHVLDQLLSTEEKNRRDRFKVKERQQEFIISRAILRIILSSYLGNNPQDVQIDFSPAGKPILSAADLFFNISHSGNLFLGGVCLDLDIGIDVQQIYPISSLDIIIKNFFSSEEKNYLNSINKDLFHEHFFSLWTAKEAYLKGIGDGFKHPFTNLDILPVDSSLTSFSVSHTQGPLTNHKWTIQAFPSLPGYKSALAVNGQVNEIININFSPDNYFPRI